MINFSRIKRLFFLFQIFIRGGYSRAEFLKKKHYFKSIGKYCYLQPFNFGTEPYLISFGDNVHVASGVNFITHDGTAFVFNRMENNNRYKVRQGTICVGSNVFIGAHSTILYNVRIGSNVIIGAGSLVNRDVPAGTIAAGVPCKVIGNFDDYREKLILSKGV